MKGQHLKRCLALLLSLALIVTAMPMQVMAASAAASSESNAKTYTITFYEDQEQTKVLQTVTVEEGVIPEWTEPTKESDEFYRYEFAGWDQEVVAAYADNYYYATWNAIEQFTATFVDWNNDLIKEVRIDKGANLAESTELPENPTRDTDGEYTYTFSGWSPALATEVTENATYVAQYEKAEIITYVDLTFKVGENGSYTVNDTAITEETAYKQTTTKTEYTLKATPAEGYEFFGWYDGATYLSADAEYTFKPTENMNITPRFVVKDTPRFSVDGEMYEGFARAITAAKKTDDKVMILMNDVTLSAGDYEIPEGITMLIPCDEEGTVYRDKPTVIDETWQSPKAYRTLTLAEGATLTINGEVSLASPHVPGAGSKENGGSPHKAYGQIVTEEGSSITVNDGGYLYAYGYITGEGSVTAKSGATVYEYFQVMDFRGGSATTDMATTGAAFGVFPLSQYYVQNIEIPLTLEAGANEYCYTSLKMSGNIVSSPIGFIGTGDDMMFKLSSGTVTKYYDCSRDRLVAEIDGDLDISPIVISGGGNTIDSDNFILPINSNITIKVNSGNINMTQDVALTPGTELIIGEDATCTLGDDCNIYVYDQDTWGNYCSSNRETFVDLNYVPGRTYIRSNDDLKDALVQVDGTLDASKGYIYTTTGGANIHSTDAGKIILRVGTATKTYQFEYVGPPTGDEKYYGIYHEIAIDAAKLKNADGTFVDQSAYVGKNIINYEYTDGVWTAIGHAYNEYEAEEATCLFDGVTYGTDCAYGKDCEEHYHPQEVIPALGHAFTVEVGAKQPTYTSVGWEAHTKCERWGAKNPDDYVEIPKLEGAVIASYDEFLKNLEILEEWAEDYVKANPGKDPVALVIKYIRTGVDRYNSGSWGIMAGYEDAAFAQYVADVEDAYNAAAAASGKELLKVSGLKNIMNFTLPNGDEVDFGHMFGTMDITYHNKYSVNHADVAGWAGDVVDLLSLADQFGTGDEDTVNEMADYITENYLLKETADLEDEYGEALKEGSFSLTDMYGDLDGYYIMKVLEATEYEEGTLTDTIKAYFTDDLDDVTRAAYLLENRFDDISLRIDLRDQVYKEVTSNKVVNTLEATREFETEDLNTLRKACCYAFADYICKLAGDYVDHLENPYVSVFSSTFSTLAPGITQKTYQAKTADGKQTDYYIATADVTRSDVQVYANYNNNDPSQGWAMQRVIDQANAAQEKYGNPESEDYIENYNVIASINGGGYDMSTGEPSGLLLMNGIEWHPCNDAGFFGILSDGTAMIGTKAEYEALKKNGKIKEAIGGFGTTLVKDGKVHITATSDYYTNRASRTAVGITKTGKVVFMVMDGRQGEYTCGGSMEEIAQIMLDAGCVEAINLDGGGSSTYVARQEGEESLSVVNSPSDGVSRSVSTSLFVVSTAPSSTAFDHAVIESDYSYLTVGSSVELTATGVSATNNSVDLPEGTTWAVSDKKIGTITEDGVFTAKANGEVEISLMLDDEVVGTKTLNVVVPDNLYFTKTSANGVYGQTVEIPVKVVYKNKPVAVNALDVIFTLSDKTAGTVEDFYFTIAETTTLKNVKITTALTADPSVSATFTVYLYNQGEASFDFDQATGGDRQFAWDRQVSNSITEDELTYSIIDQDKDMTTSYTFAIDMSQISIPEKLADLTYMLPGADMEGASAWSFLCQLAERMSDQTEVRPVIHFDEDVEVDWKNITLVNDYFNLTEKDFDEETNTLTLTLNWIKQDKPIELEQANPICILSGIKITPKDGASWNSKDQLAIVNTGEISYTVCMRASGLYTFSQNASNQEIYGLTPFVNPNNDAERGGKFTSVYKEFKDSFTLDKSIKNGWIATSGGFSYFDNGKMYTGICKVDGLYYDFGKDGVNQNQTLYTGELTVKNKEYYVINGEIFKKGCAMWNDDTDDGWLRFGTNDWRYYDPDTGVREKVTVVEGVHTCIIDTVYTFTSESGKVKTVTRDDAGGHEYVENEDGTAICSVCGWERMNMEDLLLSLGYTSTTYNGKERKPKTIAINPNTGETLAKSGLYKDYSATYTNNVEVGTAKVKFRAFKHGYYVNQQEWRGDYKGEAYLTFTILPDAPTNAKGTYNDGTVKLTWDKAQVEETDTADNNTTYVIYKSVNGGSWKKVGTTTKTSYTITKGMKNGDSIKLRIKTKKVGTDGKTYESSKYASVKMTYKTPKISATNVASTGKNKITWAKVDGAKKYEVYRATSKIGKYTKVTTTTKTSYTDKKSTTGKTYYYKVRAVKSSSKTKYSNIVSKTCDLPTAKNLKATNVAKTGKIKLTWKKVTGAKKYEVYRATSKNGKYVKIATTSKTSLTNTSAKAGKTYYYKVKAIASKSAANSAYSASVYKTCDLARPTVKATSPAKKQIKVTWKKVTGAKKYEVYRATSKNGKYKKIATTTKLSYTSKSLKSGKTYYYKVKAIASKSSANSAYSTVVSKKCR